MYLTRRDLYYPLLSLLITNTMSFTLRWNTRRKGEIYRGSKWRVDRRFDPLPLPLPMLHSPAQYDRPKYNIGGGKRALVFQLMWLGVVFAKLIWESERMNVCFGRNIFLVQERNCRFEIIWGAESITVLCRVLGRFFILLRTAWILARGLPFIRGALPGWFFRRFSLGFRVGGRLPQQEAGYAGYFNYIN